MNLYDETDCLPHVKPDGNPAFPITAGQQVYNTGMSLRDWFAGQALSGAMSTLGEVHNIRWGDVARDCYIASDAMLAARAEAVLREAGE
jgi:hypothetical protein